ncbi:MAG: bifunctional phosphopantothenoylcysteine decarboxylase/phosphopantothenate--cysteine ligase CoaBC [Clostridia bacterium]|nr:bifunctional phosphopantothenoylcysteine decarboxylase/phosphopantothenate--cysteine ligase CoaBC [Clostridia bacterium]
MKKTVVVGVSGGIAAYKSCELVSRLKKLGYTVKVVMTKNATEFVAPLTFETLSNNAVAVDIFAEKPHYEVEHVSLAKEADVLVVAPATANVIAKFAQGVADDMLTTVYAAHKGVKVVCPAMNVNMYESDANRHNVELLRSRGVSIVEPTTGLLACGDVGKGRMAEPIDIAAYVDGILTPNPDLRDKTVLVTAGATVEDVDGVRFISNYSSGKMGFALAEAAMDRGAKVILVVGRVSVPYPKGCEIVEVKSTLDMFDAVMDNLPRADVVIKAAAPADYRVKNRSDTKIKSETLTLELVKNPDIAKAVGERKGDKKLVVFAAETNDLLANASDKLLKKNADLIVANDVTQEGAGFGTDTNIATLIYSDGRMESMPIMDKRELADAILDGVLTL